MHFYVIKCVHFMCKNVYFQACFHLSERIPCPPPPLKTNSPSSLPAALNFCLLRGLHICGIIQYLFFYDCPISLSLMSSRFITITCVRISFLLKAEKYPIVGLYYYLFIYLSMETWAAAMNNAAMDVGVQISVLWFQFFWCIPRNGILYAQK